MDLTTLSTMPPWEWPGDAGEILIAALRDPRNDASDRLLAADLAGSLPAMDDDVVEALLEIVRNPADPAEIRATSAIALGPVLETTDIEGFDDDLSEPPIRQETFEEARETLHRVYGDETSPKEVRRRALEAAVRSMQDWHADAIRTAYATGDEEWKLTAVFAMRWIPGFEREIMESIKSTNPEIHREAVQAAGSREIDAAWPHVAALVRTPGTDKDLLLAAIEAAGEIRPQEAMELFGELIDSEDEDIAAAVDEALMMADSRLEFDRMEEEDDEEEEEEEGGYLN
jgi:hypothetical protein